MKFLVINGPNMNLLGIREPDIYGRETYQSLIEKIEQYAARIGIGIECFQSNHEGAIIDRIQQAYFEKIDGIVINPAGYTHTSVAIADALKAVSIPYIEVHVSEVDRRESFRQISYVRDAAFETISGHGTDGYTEAIGHLKDHLKNNGIC